MITSRTQLLWLLGHPVAQTISPGLFNPAFATAGVDMALLALDTRPAQLDAALEFVRYSDNVQGCLLTVPHKLNAYARVDRASERSNALGLVNVIRREADGHLYGDALDGEGFVDALSAQAITLDRLQTLVIGCGGAGGASAWAALEHGARCVGLYDPDTQRCERLALVLSQRFGFSRVQRLLRVSDEAFRWDVVLNASPLGMDAEDALPIEPAVLSAHAVLVDATTAAAGSRWLALARVRGHRCIDGPAFTQGQALAVARFFKLPESVHHALQQPTQAPS